MCDGGMRFNNNIWVGFQLDPDGGDMAVEVHLVDNEGVTHVITGAVVWDE